MTQRERFLKTARFEPVDRPPLWEFGYWEETLDRWHAEGMPEDINLAHYFGLDTASYFGDDPGQKIPRFFINVGLCPSFHDQVLEETDTFKIYRDQQGITKQEFKQKNASSMPHWISFPVEDRASWERFKTRLNAASPGRYPVDWDDLKKAWEKRDYPIAIFVGSLFGQLRDWVGLENFVTMFHDDPGFVAEMIEFMTDFYLQAIQKAIAEVKFDQAHFWEDMAFKTGSLISPQMVKTFMLPHYKRMADFIRKHGIGIFTLDCDGNIEELIPVWLEAGINGVYPCEVAAGMDVVQLRKKYGRDLFMTGGIDKRVLAKGKKDIEEEVMKKVPPLISIGGYVPTVDHSVPPDVSLENYRYYLQLLKQVFGIK